MERVSGRSVIGAGRPITARRPIAALASRRLVLLSLLVAAAACEGDPGETLVVRTDLPETLRDLAEDRFEAQVPGVALRFTEGDPEATLAELENEGEAPFDVWWGASALALQEASDRAALEAYAPPWLDQPGIAARGSEADWQVTMVTPFVIAFNREALPISRAPSEWSDLFHFRWVDEIVALDPTRSADGAYFLGAIGVEALRDDDDLNRGLEWMQRLGEQVTRWVATPEEGVRALRTGEATIAILPRAAVESARSGDAPWIHYRIPRSGAPVLARGVAIARGTRVPDAARRFVDLVGRADVTTEAALRTWWEPGHGEVERAKLPADFMVEQAWTGYPLAADTLVSELDGWVQRWDLEFRGR